MTDIGDKNARPGDEAGRARDDLRETRTVADLSGDHGETDTRCMPSFDTDTMRPFLDAGMTLIPLHHWNALDRRGKEIGKAPQHHAWQARRYNGKAVISAAMQRGHNLGVRLSPDVVVIDADPRNYAEGVDSFAKLVADFGIELDAYPHVRTGGGGLHVYMHKPHDVVVLDSLDGYPGVEFKSAGRQVVAPGSIHPSGVKYVGFNMELLALEMPAPAALIERIKRAPRPTPLNSHAGELTATQVVGALDSIDPTNFRDEAKWRELMFAAHYATDGDAREEFIAWSTSDPMYADDAWKIGRRWDSLHADRKTSITARTFYKLVQDAGGAVPNVSPDEDFAAWEDGPEGMAERLRWTVRSLDDLENMPPPRWIVRKVLQEGTVAVLFGPPSEGKSFVALDLALHLAACMSWHEPSRTVMGGDVLYVAAEGAAGLAKRTGAWRKAHPVALHADAFRLVSEPLNLSNKDEAKMFLGFVELEHKRAPLRLIVIDTLSQTSTGADENSNTEMAIYFKHVQALVNRTGATVLVIHHSGKDVSKGERGAFAIRGNVDTSIEVKRTKNRANGDPIDVIRLGIKKQKDDEAGRIGDFEMYAVPLGLDQEGHPYDSLVLRPHGIAVTDCVDKEFLDPTTRLLNWIAETVAEKGGRMLLKELIKARLPLETVKEGTVRKNVNTAIKEGRDAARITTDGTAVWMERAGKNPNGDLIVAIAATAS